MKKTMRFENRLKTFLLAAVLSLVPFLNNAAEPFTITSDEASGIYTGGRDIVFTVKPGEGKSAADLEKASAKILFNGDTELPAEKASADGAITLRVKPSKPGAYRCDVTLPAQGDAKAMTSSAGTLVCPADIRSAGAEPADLDAFWKAKKDFLKSAPLSFDTTPLPEDQKKSVAGAEYADYECFTLRIEVPVKGVRPVMGYFVRPKTAKAGGCPAILRLRAAGVSGSWCIANPKEAMNFAKMYGAMVLDINAHGIPNDKPKEYYVGLENGELKNYSAIGKTNKDDFYFVGMYLRLLRSIDFLCAEKSWNGRHLIAIGESQGGGQALAAAGLDSRVSAISAIVPALCALTDPQLAGWPRPLGWNSKQVVMNDETREIAKAVAYCDNVFLASRSKAETQIFAGLIDTTCPANGIFATYNNISAKKCIIAYPHKGHQGLPKEDQWVGDIYALQKTFLQQHLSAK
jgi:cephalosporin-C deacetylase-like acetyl esterase